MPGQALRMAVELRRLRRRWQLDIPEPPPIPLAPPTECIIEGFASTTDLDLDHVKLASRTLTWAGDIHHC